VVDWNLVDKDEYLSAMRRSVVKDLEIKALLKQAQTDRGAVVQSLPPQVTVSLILREIP
jgi:hypothetical protein